MNLLVHAIGMLCALGTATLAAAARGSRYTVPALALGFAVSVVAIAPERMPNPVWIGGWVALVAILELARPGFEVLTAAAAGALAGLWFSLLQIQGLSMTFALVLAAAVPATSAFMASRSSRFMPASLGDEALLVVIALALIVAVTPDVSAGWRSALVLNLENESARSQELSRWVLVLTGSSVALGGLYSLVWRSR